MDRKEILDQIAKTNADLIESRKLSNDLRKKIAELSSSLGAKPNSAILHTYEGENYVFEFDGDGDIDSTRKLRKFEEAFEDSE
jgi:hypothetical protein